eukprot:gene14619-biopygen4913
MGATAAGRAGGGAAARRRRRRDVVGGGGGGGAAAATETVGAVLVGGRAGEGDGGGVGARAGRALRDLRDEVRPRRVGPAQGSLLLVDLPPQRDDLRAALLRHRRRLTLRLRSARVRGALRGADAGRRRRILLVCIQMHLQPQPQ